MEIKASQIRKARGLRELAVSFGFWQALKGRCGGRGWFPGVFSLEAVVTRGRASWEFDIGAY